MTLKNAALLALVGTILMTALLVWTFVLTFLNVLLDLVPAVTLFSSFIYAFGCFSVVLYSFTSSTERSSCDVWRQRVVGDGCPGHNSWFQLAPCIIGLPPGLELGGTQSIPVN